MTWKLSLSLECGPLDINAALTGAAIHNLTLRISPQFPYKIRTFQDIEENWWCSLFPEEYDRQNEAQVKEFLEKSLRALAQANIYFRYGLVGLEVEEFRTHSELLDDQDQLASLFPGLVINKAFFNCPFDPLPSLGFKPISQEYFMAEL